MIIFTNLPISVEKKKPKGTCSKALLLPKTVKTLEAVTTVKTEQLEVVTTARP